MKRLLILLALPLLFAACSPPTPEEIAIMEKEALEKAVKDSVNAVNEKIINDSLLIVQIEKEIDSFKKPFDNSSYNNSVIAIQLEVSIFSIWWSIIEKAEKSENDQAILKSNVLKKKVVHLQNKEFPIIRKRYCNVVKRLMWEHDIEVNCVGRGNRIISFVGGRFAANKNKKTFQSDLTDVLHQLRFTQSRYRWRKGQEDYTYYTIEVLKDSELVR